MKDDETERSAVAFLKEAVRAFPFQVTHVLTDRGSCFTADGFEAACQKLGVEHRKTRPYTPKTNGMVERFNGRIQREVLGITVASHRDLETLLHGFNQAYNARRQRVLKGRSPDMVVRERLSATPDRANRSHDPPFDPCSLPKALQVIARAKDVSHPDNYAKVMLDLAGGYALGLAKDAQVVVYINGRSVASTRLPKSAGDVFRQNQIPLPLGY